MTITLKRNKALTPIIFTTDMYTNSNIVKLYRKEGYNCIYKGEEFYLSLDKSMLQTFIYCTNNLNLIREYFIFYGGIFIGDTNRIIALIVVNPSNKEFCIVEKEFSEQYPSYFGKIKKSINMLGISSRSRLVLATKEEIFTNFQQTIVPDMEDYMDEVKLTISTEFLNKFKNG